MNRKFCDFLKADQDRCKILHYESQIEWQILAATNKLKLWENYNHNNANNFGLKRSFNLSLLQRIPVNLLVKKSVHTYSRFASMRLHTAKSLVWRFRHKLHSTNITSCWSTISANGIQQLANSRVCLQDCNKALATKCIVSIFVGRVSLKQSYISYVAQTCNCSRMLMYLENGE